MVLQNYQNFIEMTSNMIYIAALGVGLKCLRKIHFEHTVPPPTDFQHTPSIFNKHLAVKFLLFINTRIGR